jgi:hypothetical protein
MCGQKSVVPAPSAGRKSVVPAGSVKIWYLWVFRLQQGGRGITMHFEAQAGG